MPNPGFKEIDNIRREVPKELNNDHNKNGFPGGCALYNGNHTDGDVGPAARVKVVENRRKAVGQRKFILTTIGVAVIFLIVGSLITGLIMWKHYTHVEIVMPMVVLSGKAASQCKASVLVIGGVPDFKWWLPKYVGNTGFMYTSVDKILVSEFEDDIQIERLKTSLTLGRLKTTASAHEQSMYLFGGASEFGPDVFNALNTGVMYNYKNNIWQQIAPMKHNRAGSIVLKIDNKMFVVGGRVQYRDRYLTKVESYNIDENTWEEQHDIPYGLGFSAGCVVDGIGYLVSGWLDNRTSTRDILVMHYKKDTNTITWEVRSGVLHPGRWGHSVTTDGAVIFIMGGYNERELLLDEVLSYNPISGELVRLAPMPWGRGLTLTFSLVNHIYVVGGWGMTRDNNTSRNVNHLTAIASILRYDIQDNRWQQLNTTLFKPSLYHVGGVIEKNCHCQ